MLGTFREPRAHQAHNAGNPDPRWPPTLLWGLVWGKGTLTVLPMRLWDQAQAEGPAVYLCARVRARSFHKHVWSTCCVPAPILGIRDASGKRADGSYCCPFGSVVVGVWGPGDWADAEAKGGLSGAIICKPVSKDVFVFVCLCLGGWVCPRVHGETTLGWAHRVGLWEVSSSWAGGSVCRPMCP